jgi:DNA-binding NtrC family response regulator
MACAVVVSAPATTKRILVTSPNDAYRTKLCERLYLEASLVDEATGGADAVAKLDARGYDTVFLDKRLADLQAEEVAAILERRDAAVRVVFVDSGEGGEAEANPPSCAETTDNAAFQRTGPQQGSRAVPDAPSEPGIEPLPGMHGKHRSMQQVFRMARLVAPYDTTVLITGETGTGKELVANAIHQISRRRNGPFVVVNCAAIPEELLEAELFGHARGAFTGAVQSRIGRIHAAHGGTLFLDEAGDLPLHMQAKLLRFLQHGEVQRLGSPDIFRVDVRVIAATNANLKEQVAERQFRSDLYYRLAVFPIQLPNLAMRREDILPLSECFLEKLCADAGTGFKSLTPAAAALLQRHAWPGNVRELEHAIERAFILSEDRPEISADLFQMPFEDSTP